MKRNGKTYVIVTSNNLGYETVFLSWNDQDSYTTVDYLDKAGTLDFFDTIEEAISRANAVNETSFGGWQAPMNIMEVLNFDEAYNKGERPYLIKVETIRF